MFEELISKKELLEKMKISYGQLYRWKRKKIIPEEWFIKKSVSTGQETFFPRKEILCRINKILELKDEISLDDLANQFSYDVNNVKLKKAYLINHKIISQNILEKFEMVIKFHGEIYEQSRLFALFVFEELIKTGFLSIDEINEITLAIFKGYSKLINNDSVLIIKRKFGVCFYYVQLNEEEILIDENSAQLNKIYVKDIIQKIKELN